MELARRKLPRAQAARARELLWNVETLPTLAPIFEAVRIG